MFVGISAAIHGIKKETGIVKAGLVIAGILNVFVFGFLSYEFLANPVVWALNNLTYFFILASVAAGIVIYLGSKRYNARRGIDISLAYKELPPE